MTFLPDTPRIRALRAAAPWIALAVLFDEGHSLEERMLAEQFSA